MRHLQTTARINFWLIVSNVKTVFEDLKLSSIEQIRKTHAVQNLHSNTNTHTAERILAFKSVPCKAISV